MRRVAAFRVHHGSDLLLAPAGGSRTVAGRRWRRHWRAAGSAAVVLVSVVGLAATLHATVVTTLSVVPQDGPFVVSTPPGVPGLGSRVPVLLPGGSVGAVADVTDLGSGRMEALALDAIVTGVQGPAGRSVSGPASAAGDRVATGLDVTVRACTRQWISSSADGKLICPGRATVPGAARRLHVGVNPILLGGVSSGSTAHLDVVVGPAAGGSAGSAGSAGSVRITWRFDASTAPD